MADLVLPNTTKPQDGTRSKPGISGAAVTAGNSVYQATDGFIYPTVGDTAAHAASVGIAVNTVAGAGQPVDYVSDGYIVASGMTQGTPYGVAPVTPGALAPFADIDTANKYSTFVIIAISATVALVRPAPSGVTL